MGTDYKYLVGIRCFTYNQSAYIPDALNGFVSQQTTFPFVIMVVDDASTDGEQDVIKSFITDNFDGNTTKDESRDYADITFAQHKTNKNCYIVACFCIRTYTARERTQRNWTICLNGVTAVNMNLSAKATISGVIHISWQNR